MADLTPLPKRFWKKVVKCEPNECWYWKANTYADGYGQISVKGKPRQAHRVAYELCVGPIPEGLCVLHYCDNPSCVNPQHLYVGTHSDNMQDRAKRGRQPRYGAPAHTLY